MSNKVADELNENFVKDQIFEKLRTIFTSSFPEGIHKDDYVTLIIEGKTEKELLKRLKLVLKGSETKIVLNLLISFLVQEFGLNPKGEIGVILRKAKKKEVELRESMEDFITFDD